MSKKINTTKHDLVVKYKQICSVHGDSSIETEDTRYTLRVSKIKVIKWLIKKGFRFSIGINQNDLISNLNYIEVYSDSFLAKNHYERNELIDHFLKKYAIKISKKRR